MIVDANAKTLNDILNGKQNALVSGENIKTVNVESILGTGNIEVRVEETGENNDELKNTVLAVIKNNDLDGVDHYKSYFTIEVKSDKMYFDFQSLLWRGATPATYIDWGDGTACEISVDDDCKHTYSEIGTYTITASGLTNIPQASVRGINLLRADLSRDIVNLGNNAFFEITSSGYDIYLNSENAPNITNANAFGNGKVYVKDSNYLKFVSRFRNMIYGNTNLSHIVYNNLVKRIFPIQSNTIYKDIEVTVGQNGDYSNLNDALTALSKLYPVYKNGGISCVIKILPETIINEQIFVKQLDLQWITITAEANADHTETITIDGTSHTIAIVDVNANGFGVTADAHDSRGNYPFMACENAGKFPTIGCLFRLLTNTVESGKTICGLLCNRGSEAIVLAASGFDGFYDGVIANNESSITIREGISRNMTRWGVHARHNGEVSARSCVCTNCGIGACADRVADLDIREAVLDGSAVAIECNNISRANANGCHANNCGSASDYIVKVSGGGFANCGSLEVGNPQGGIYNQEKNALTSNGIIFA